MTAARMNKIRNFVVGLKPTVLMVVVVAAFAVANVLYKLAEQDGMSSAVVNAYRFIFATVFMVPLALIYDRKNKPKLTRRVFYMIFLCGLFGGTLFQNLYLESLVLTSATFVSATFNLVPAITFILAISFRLEKLNLGTAAGKGKVVGTIIGIGGAMLMTFYKGKEIKIWSSHINFLHSRDQQNSHMAPQNAGFGRQVLGALCAFGSCFSYALWLIIQGLMSKDSKEYPSHHSNTALMSTMAAIQSTAFALCVERDWSQWKLGWNVRLLTVAYSGIVASGAMVIAIAWCIEKRGPVFASVFSPLMLVLVAIAASLTLEEKLYLGSVLGAALVVCGLYMVLWGKKIEIKTRNQSVPSQISQSQVERVVVPPPVDDKSDQITTCIAKDHNNSPKSGREGHVIPGKGEEEDVVSSIVSDTWNGHPNNL